MKSPEISNSKDAVFEAGMNNKVPHAEIKSPSANPFLYPNEFKMSRFMIAEMAKYTSEPTVYAT